MPRPARPWTVHPDISPHLEETAEVDLTDDAVLTDLSVVEADCGQARARLVDITGTRWRATSLNGSRIDKLTLTDSAFTACDLAVLVIEESSWQRVTLTNCRLRGLTVSGSTLTLVEIEDAVADLSVWRMATLTRVRITGGRWQQADFTGATLDEVTFTGCDLSGADFSHATVRRVRFEDCRFDQVNGLAGLRGAQLVFSHPTDALGLVAPMAEALGLDVS